MSFPFLPVRYSLLSASALGTLVQELWQLDTPCHCQLLQPAQSGGNDLYLVTSGTYRFVLRAYVHGSRSLEALEAGAQMMAALAQQNVAVNRPLPLVQGAFTTSIQAPEGLRHLQLFAFISGAAPGWQMTEEQATQYGRTVAHLHEITDHLPHYSALPTLDEEILLHAPAQVIVSFLDESTPQAQDMKKLAMRLQKRFARLPRTRPAYGLCHADCHKRNILCTQDGQVTLIDFDCAGYSWRAYELSVLLWSFSRTTESGNLGYEQQVWDAYLNGYQHLRPLDSQTLEAISWFVLVRHLWWMAIDLRKIQQELMGQGWLDTTWFERHFDRLQQWMQLFSLS